MSPNAQYEKPPLTLEFLETIGITNNCIGRTISILETISELLNGGKCEWSKSEKSPSQVSRLKYAAKKLMDAIGDSQILSSVTAKNRDRAAGQWRVRNISDNSGIARLRNLRAAKMEEVYQDGTCAARNLPCIENSEFRMISDIDVSTLPKITEADFEFFPYPQSCYMCKINFTEIHEFYDQLCPGCAELNYEKRFQSADLSGKVALVTGGRVKIGYEVVLKLLRCGAHVITTTRFPNDASKRYQHEADFDTWGKRLDIYGLDLRFLGNVENFCDYVSKNYHRLDILVQNAAQTVRRPPAFYAHLIRDEISPLESSNLVKNFQNLNFIAPKIPSQSQTTNTEIKIHDKFLDTQGGANVALVPSAITSQLNVHPDDGDHEQNGNFFPPGRFDGDHQQLDLRVKNSWLLEAPEVDTSEVVEVSIVNYIAPFVIMKKLTPLMKSTVGAGVASENSETNSENFEKSSENGNSEKYGWIILVSALEGQFYREKSSRHPHTNCAKASLNMLARTSGQYYAQFNLLLNSVDTGWVTNEDPYWLRQRKEHQKGFVPPLDEIDGAARILDPMFLTINSSVTEFGKFYKDYKETVW